MANATIDTSELEYLKSCRDKLRDIDEILGKEDGDDDEKKLKEIKRIIGGELASRKSKKKAGG